VKLPMRGGPLSFVIVCTTAICASIWTFALVDAPKARQASATACPCPAAVVVPAVDPPVPSPGPLNVAGPAACAPGEQVELKATGEATWVKWQTEAKFAGPYEGGRVIVFTSPVPGRFVFFLSGDVKGKGEGDEHVVVVGTPAPPVPVPPVPPIPTPPTPVVGPLKLFVVYESKEVNPELARMSTALRAGPEAAALKAKGHSLDFLDPDVHAAQLAKAGLPGKADIPFLGIVDSAGKVVARTKLEKPVTAAGVMDLIKKAGG
jgi:hypothetical protein